jgi:hypothetical protein
MSRRLYVVPFAFSLLLASLPATASDRACTREALPQARVAPRIDVLAAVFDARQVADPTSGKVTTIETTEVVIARIGADGKLVLACVDTKDAARRFLEIPAGRLASHGPKEQ